MLIIGNDQFWKSVRTFLGRAGRIATAAFARRHRIPSGCTDPRRALSETDAAVMASPSGFHATQALQALKLGVHVFVELPACETAGEIYAFGGDGHPTQSDTDVAQKDDQSISGWMSRL